MRILDFLKELAEIFKPDWEALAMFWPEVMTFLVVCFLLGTAYIYLGDCLDRWAVQVNNPTYPKRKTKTSHSYRTDRTNRGLQARLIELLRGDVATAKRLLAQQRRKHPGRTDNWYLEKVIWDLERDRRR